MAVGDNIKYGSRLRLLPRFLEIMGSRGHLRKASASGSKFCYKAGAPANNTAADNPNALGDICIDTENNDVYVCTAYTADASATTWTKISD